MSDFLACLAYTPHLAALLVAAALLGMAVGAALAWRIAR